MNKIEIINCDFQIKCDEHWDNMQETPFKDIRHCQVCAKPVFRCTSDDQVAWASKLKYCCAVKTGNATHGEIEIGLPLPK